MSKISLLEDKVVKFNNATYPKFGWCVMMCGGPGAGKSTVLKNIVPIEGKVYNADTVKEMAVTSGEIVDNKLIFNGKEYSLDGIDPPYNLNNSEFVSFLHMSLKPLNKKIKSNLFKLGISAEQGRLPNIIFDMTGDDPDDFTNIIYQLQDVGYKFCVVWVFNSVEASIENNSRRERKILEDILINKCHDVYVSMLYVINKSGLMSLIDDFWVVFPMKINMKTPQGKYEYIKSDNVKRLSSLRSSALLRQLEKMVYDQLYIIDTKYSKYLPKEKQDTSKEI